MSSFITPAGRQLREKLWTAQEKAQSLRTCEQPGFKRRLLCKRYDVVCTSDIFDIPHLNICIVCTSGDVDSISARGQIELRGICRLIIYWYS